MISSDLLEEVTVELLRRAAVTLPRDVISALEKALEEETSEIARTQLRTILENVRAAADTSVPMCQDTGIPIFFVKGVCGKDVVEGIRKGVSRATAEVPLRPNAVHPITRKNEGNNLGIDMPYIHFSPGDDATVEITVLPKGAGSENMSALRMLSPTEGMKGVRSFVLDTVLNAGGRPCPPIIVGVGIGGSADIAMALSKKALLKPLDLQHPDPELRRLEEELLDALNSVGIGPMGLGGRTTALGVKIEIAHCHTASLPVGVNIQCWAARRASVRIHVDGRVEFSTEGFW